MSLMTITTFSRRSEYEKAVTALEGMSLAYEEVSPDPGYSVAACPAIVMTQETRRALNAGAGEGIVFSGWVDYRPAKIAVPDEKPPEYAEDIFGHASVTVLAPCVADPEKIRIVAHITGDISPVFPYLNATVKGASYNKNDPNLTFMDGYRMISLYPNRIAVAKPDEIVDAWRTLEMIRHWVNSTWSRRGEIEPDFTLHVRPPALEIFKRLPRTNCRQCGEITCIAFAAKVYMGQESIDKCAPVFTGDQGHLKDALLEICQGLGTVLEEKSNVSRNKTRESAS